MGHGIDTAVDRRAPQAAPHYPGPVGPRIWPAPRPATDAASLGGCKIGVALPARLFFSRKSAAQCGCGKILAQNPACSRCWVIWLRLGERYTRCIVLLPGLGQPQQRCWSPCAAANPRCTRCTADFSGKIGTARSKMTVQPRWKIDAIDVMAKRARGFFGAADATPSLREKISLALPARPIFWKKSAMHSLHGRFSGKNRPCNGGKVHETLPRRPGTAAAGVESFRDGPVSAILAS